MPRDYEYDRLRDAQNDAWDAMKDAERAMNDAWDRSQDVQNLHGSRVEQLKEEHDRTYESMKEAFEDASQAFDNGDHTAARTYADRGKEFKAELPGLTAERRRLIDELKAARDDHKRAREDYLRKKAEWKDAKGAFDYHKEAMANAKQDALRMTDIPYEYRHDVVLVRGNDNSMDLYFGGDGEPNGPGHGHYHYDSSGTLTYQREPGESHGGHNYVRPTAFMDQPKQRDPSRHDVYFSTSRGIEDPHGHVVETRAPGGSRVYHYVRDEEGNVYVDDAYRNRRS